MIKHWLVTGDTHGDMSRLSNIDTKRYPPEETGVIILGDFGVNFFLNKTDRNKKRNLMNTGFRFYAVRGNHEQRPELIPGMESVQNSDVAGEVWREPEFPNISYFKDGGEYIIGGHSALVIGGTYSVDKWCRLMRAGRTEDMDDDYIVRYAGWFPREQLTSDEMANIMVRCAGHEYDFILTHTCPLPWEPTDLFLGGVDQAQVDKSMEKWLDAVKDACRWKVWLFGHYHDDRLVRPRVEMLYRDMDDLKEIWNRWYGNCPERERIGWWLKKDPKYDMT